MFLGEVSEKETLVLKGDTWYRVKNENATVEISFKLDGENVQETEELVLLDNKWYLACDTYFTIDESMRLIREMESLGQ